jgi:hypothetical protein
LIPNSVLKHNLRDDLIIKEQNVIDDIVNIDVDIIII